MKLIQGAQIAAQIRNELKERTASFEAHFGKSIGLAVVLIGDDPASAVYVRNKIKACEEVGIKSNSYRLPATVTQVEAEKLIDRLAQDNDIHGILIQLPLPKHLDEKSLLLRIPPQKDVDGFLPDNIGKLALNECGTFACTPSGVMEMLRRCNISVAGQNAVVIGRSNIVGRPMALMLLNADATVTICHSKTKDLKEQCLRADILVAAIGKPNFVTADMVKEGAVVIDVGINRIDGKLCGDVDFQSVKDKAFAITPVPGGVGPMTIAMLLKNTCDAAERAQL